MVLAVVMDAKYTEYDDREDFYVYLDVYGLRSDFVSGVVDFITGWAETLRFDYFKLYGVLRKWGYFLAELSRRKISIAEIPYDTYEFDKEGEVNSNRNVWIYVDEGSPFRHVYVTLKDDEKYVVKGYGVWDRSFIRLDLDINEDVTSNLITYYRHKYDTLAIYSIIEKPEIYTIIYPDADDETEKTFTNILKQTNKLGLVGLGLFVKT